VLRLLPIVGPSTRRIRRVGLLALLVTTCALPPGAASAQDEESGGEADPAERELAERVGFVVLILFRPPFWLLTVVVGAASMLVLPLAAIAMTLLYGDAVQQENDTQAADLRDDGVPAPAG
jgi:hypothetical protein